MRIGAEVQALPRAAWLIRTATAADLPGILALNRTAEAETSSLDAGSLASLAVQAFALLVAPGGFLLALDQDADYASPNFRWFHARHQRFVYIDRVIVDQAHRHAGVARALYAALSARAAAAGQVRLTCEVNTLPPNPASLAAHARLGFVQVGEVAHTATRRVAFLERSVPAAGR